MTVVVCLLIQLGFDELPDLSYELRVWKREIRGSEKILLWIWSRCTWVVLEKDIWVAWYRRKAVECNRVVRHGALLGQGMDPAL